MSNRNIHDVAKIGAAGRINYRITDAPGSDGREEAPFSVGFKNFKDKLCVIKDMKTSEVRKVHEAYRGMGACKCFADFQNSLHDIKVIENRGHYSKYFSGLTPDTELREFDAGSCRGFFYLDNANKIAQIVAIDHHPEYRKNKK